MHRFWLSIIRPILEILHARTIVEVGVFRGDQSRLILEEYCVPQHAILHGIDPVRTAEIDNLCAQFPDRFIFHEGLSLNALSRIGHADAVLIDGDHNWYTVRNELSILEQMGQENGAFPVVFLHDTEWPYGRRDSYTALDLIPQLYRIPSKRGGIFPGNDNIVPDAGLNPDLQHAVYTHAMQSGIRTALEDFLKETTLDLHFQNLPGFHGLGILLPKTLLLQYPGLAVFLRSIHVAEPIAQHIEKLESERIEYFLNANALGQQTHTLQQRIHQVDAEHREEHLALETERRQAAFERQRAELLSKEQERLQEEVARNRREQMESLEQQERLRDELAQVRRERMEILGEQERLRDEHKQLLHQVRLSARQAEVQEQKRAHLAEEYDQQTALLHHMHRTRSWRWTAPLRHAGNTSNRVAYAFFRVLKDIWTDFGEPLPLLVRGIRHGLLGRCWPAQHPNTPAYAPEPPTAQEPITSMEEPLTVSREVSVAVVIPCHNYGHFLGEAIESTLRQSLKPAEIVVVDDASDDDTAAVAARYAESGVRYLRGDWRSVGEARDAGLRTTHSPYLVFLDADNVLHPDYLQCGIDALLHAPEAALAYPDQQCFGQRTDFYTFPATFNWQLFDRQNHMDSVAMVRRDALRQAGGWSHGVGQDGDWVTWRRVLALGWKAVKSRGLFYYRVHGANMIFTLGAERTYAERAGFFEEPATLCIALSGRDWAWPLTVEFLSRQTFPHNKLHLVVLDTSGDASFGNAVRSWLRDCDYAGTTYLQDDVFPPSLADLPRTEQTQEVSHACARIYNTFARHCDTTLALFLEDDILPPLDAFPRLIGHFTGSVLSVGGFYRNRQTRYPIGWKEKGVEYQNPDDHPSHGTSPVFGSGLGCTVIRGSYLRHNVFRSPPGVSFDYDYFARAHEPLSLLYPVNTHPTVHPTGWETLVDWDCACRHYSGIDTWV